MTPDDPAAWLRAKSGYGLAGVFAFGDSPAMADELLAFVQRGTKRATAGAVADLVDEETFVPSGMYWGVLDGRGAPQVLPASGCRAPR